MLLLGVMILLVSVKLSKSNSSTMGLLKNFVKTMMVNVVNSLYNFMIL